MLAKSILSLRIMFQAPKREVTGYYSVVKSGHNKKPEQGIVRLKPSNGKLWEVVVWLKHRVLLGIDREAGRNLKMLNFEEGSQKLSLNFVNNQDLFEEKFVLIL